MKHSVSIGLPVYNGGKLLREALDSLLAQDYDNFELIISDNASTDETAEICSEYAARDPRIKFFRAKQNKGASWNFNRVLELSGGEFFMWAAHDDLWLPNFVSECVKSLLEEKDAVLCHSHIQLITLEGAIVGEPDTDIRNEEPTMRERWRKTHENWQLHAAIYGLMRTDIVKKILPVTTVPSSDLIFIAELSLYGKIIQIPQTLQLKRLPSPEEARYKSAEGMMKYLGATSISKVRMHRLGVMFKCISTLKHAKLPAADVLKLSFDIFYIYLKSQFLIDFKEWIKSYKFALFDKKAVN